MRLPQELFAEALWLEWDNHYGIIHKEKLPDLLRRCNLKLKKEKTLDDIQLAFGRGLKDTFGNPYLRPFGAFFLLLFLKIHINSESKFIDERSKTKYGF